MMKRDQKRRLAVGAVCLICLIFAAPFAAGQTKDAAVEIVNHPAGVHGFDNRTDDARSREIIRRFLNFLAEKFGER